jgi:hypothetical protein
VLALSIKPKKSLLMKGVSPTKTNDSPDPIKVNMVKVLIPEGITCLPSLFNSIGLFSVINYILIKVNKIEFNSKKLIEFFINAFSY